MPFSAQPDNYTAGGLKTGSVYKGWLDFGSELDLEKLVDWHGARASTNWIWLSGNDAGQDVNLHGFRWRLDALNGFTWMKEAHFYGSKADESRIPPVFLNLGVWLQSGQYADALADSTSSGNTGYYLVLDQMLFRENGEADPKSDEGLGFFGRPTGMRSIFSLIWDSPTKA